MPTTTAEPLEPLTQDESFTDEPMHEALWPNKFLYDEFAGRKGEAALNAILQDILPTALWRTWRCAVEFQAPGRPLFVGVSRIATSVKAGERKVYLDLQELEARHLLKTTPTAMQIVQNDGTIVTRIVTLKDFSALYALAHEYHLWLASPDYIPATRESAAYIKTQPALMRKLVRFDNYRRLLLCRKPGRKPHPKAAHSWYSDVPPADADETDEIPFQAHAYTASTSSVPFQNNTRRNTCVNRDSLERIKRESFHERDSCDSELTSEGGEGHPVPDEPTAEPQHLTYDSEDRNQRDETQESENHPLLPEIHESPDETPILSQQPVSPTHPTDETSQSHGKREQADLSDEQQAYVQQALAAWKQTHQGKPQRIGRETERHERGDGKPRPIPNRLVSGFVRHIATLFGDENVKGSITRALRLTQEAGLVTPEELLTCLVKAYLVTHNTHKVKHLRTDGSPNKMPLFLKMLGTFAIAYRAGKLDTHSLTEDIASDDRLILWVMEQGLELPSSSPTQTMDAQASHADTFSAEEPAESDPHALQVSCTDRDEADKAEERAETTQEFRIEVSNLASDLPDANTAWDTSQRRHAEQEQWHIATVSPEGGWPSFESAEYWAQRLLLGCPDCAYQLGPTRAGRWAFVLWERADPSRQWICETTEQVRWVRANGLVALRDAWEAND